MSADRIEKEIILNSPLQRVWQALTDSTEFGTWFGVRFTEPFAPGAAMHGVVTPTKVNAETATGQQKYQGIPFDISIERMEPERLFSFRWHPYAIERGVDYSAEPTTLVVFTLTETEGGVKLNVTETGFDGIPLARRASAFTANERGWAAVTKLLETYLASGT